MKGKIQYHHKSKRSMDKNDPQLTSSPIESRTKKVDNILEKMNLDDDRYIDDNNSYKNTIQSMNDKDNVNYLIESNNNNGEIFKTAMKKTPKMVQSTQQSEVLFEDTDNNYVESSNKLLETIKKSLDYFRKSQELSFKNDDKLPTVMILKEDYEKMKIEYERILMENEKLKEKNKILKENSVRSNAGVSENLNIAKFIDSLMYLQTKNEDLEKENKNLKSENEELVKILKMEKKRRGGNEEKQTMSKNKAGHMKSQNNIQNQNKNKQDQMEILLKEQISCMKKMLLIVQDGKESTTTSAMSKKKNSSQNEFIDIESDIESNIHFEESFNVTNMSNSGDLYPEADVINSSEKDYENKISTGGNNQKFEILLKPFEKNKKTDKKTENAVDDDIQRFPQSHAGVKSNNQSRDLNSFYLNKDQSKPKSNSPSVNFNLNFSKTNKRLENYSHRVNPK